MSPGEASNQREPDCALIVVAAGSGERMGAAAPKVLLPLAGQSLLAHAVGNGLASGVVTSLVVAAPPGALLEADEIVERSVKVTANPPWYTVISGGADRGKSVAAGLRALVEGRRGERIVLVHDAARPLAPAGLFSAVAFAVRSSGEAVVPGLAVTDTVKRVDANGLVIETPQRDELRAVQTPQGFPRDVLERAHARARPATDDAALVEELGLPVRVIPGAPAAFKITYPADLRMAADFLTDK